MANTAGNVIVGKPKATGGALRAPAGTEVPTTNATAWDALGAEFLAVGYVSQDGVVQSLGTGTSDIIAWGGDNVRTVQTEHTVTYALTMIETSALTARVYYGETAVAETAATETTGNLLAIEITSAELERGVWCFEIVDAGRKGRIYLPDAQVTERGDVSYVDADAVSYPVTLTAYPDANGVKAYIFWDDGQLLDA